jgi:hypothetical protein
MKKYQLSSFVKGQAVLTVLTVLTVQTGDRFWCKGLT